MKNKDILEPIDISQRIRVKDFVTSYIEVGAGENPIIFLHGFPFDNTTWQRQLEFFAPTHRAIAVNIRGFGDATAGRITPSITEFADDLIHFMDELNIKKAIVCGLSMGGYILLQAVSLFPNRFEALILCDTQCIPDTEDQKAKRAEAIAHVEQSGVSGFAETFIKKVFFKNTYKKDPMLVENTKDIILLTSEKAITFGLQSIADRECTCVWLTDIEMPTLIICGSEDSVTPLEQSERMHKEIKNSVLKIIPHAGHLSNQEQPQTFNNHLLEFIENLPVSKNKTAIGNRLH